MIRRFGRLACVLMVMAVGLPMMAAGDPVREIASDRFAFTTAGHQLVVSYEATHPLDEQHPERDWCSWFTASCGTRISTIA